MIIPDNWVIGVVQKMGKQRLAASIGHAVKPLHTGETGIIIEPMSETAQVGRTGRHSDLDSWRPAPDAPRLSRGSVHVWSVPLLLPDSVLPNAVSSSAATPNAVPANAVPLTGQLADPNKLLSLDEQERGQRFRFDRHRRRFIVARASLRQILGRYTGEDCHNLVIETGRYGKPFLAGNTMMPDLAFNVTHSGELALIAVALDRQVGVDVERVRVIEDADAIAKQYFSLGECASLITLEDGQRHRGFLDCWTRKEAFIKAIGEGLTFPLDDFQVSLDPAAPAQLLYLKGVPDPARHWSLFAFEPEAGYVAALACAGAPTAIDGYRFQPFAGQ